MACWHGYERELTFTSIKCSKESSHVHKLILPWESFPAHSETYMQWRNNFFPQTVCPGTEPSSSLCKADLLHFRARGLMWPDAAGVAFILPGAITCLFLLYHINLCTPFTSFIKNKSLHLFNGAHTQLYPKDHGHRWHPSHTHTLISMKELPCSWRNTHAD